MVCSQKLGKVSESIIQLGDENRDGFRNITSQVSQSTNQLTSEIKSGFSTTSSQSTISESANQARHRVVLTHIDHQAKLGSLNNEKIDGVSQQQSRSIDLNEAGFQAVHSGIISAASSNLKEHKTTHAMLTQYQGHIQQMIRKHITFRVVDPRAHSSPSNLRASIPTETVVFWKHSCHRTPIGTLNIQLRQTRQSRNSRRSTAQDSAESHIAVEFVPPWWLSMTAIKYSIKLSSDLISNQLHWGSTLQPLTVSHDPFFLDAIWRLDVEGVRRSFTEGLAKPTDYILSQWCGPMP